MTPYVEGVFLLVLVLCGLAALVLWKGERATPVTPEGGEPE